MAGKANVDSEGRVKVPDDRQSKPSTMHHGDLYIARLYTDESVDGHVYNNVKHLWFKAGGSLLCICHFYADGSYRFVCWPASQVRWFQLTPQRFEAE